MENEKEREKESEGEKTMRKRWRKRAKERKQVEKTTGMAFVPEQIPVPAYVILARKKAKNGGEKKRPEN